MCHAGDGISRAALSAPVPWALPNAVKDVKSWWFNTQMSTDLPAHLQPRQHGSLALYVSYNSEKKTRRRKSSHLKQVYTAETPRTYGLCVSQRQKSSYSAQWWATILKICTRMYRNHGSLEPSPKMSPFCRLQCHCASPCLGSSFNCQDDSEMLVQMFLQNTGPPSPTCLALLMWMGLGHRNRLLRSQSS